MDWISVKDRLPDNESEILVSNGKYVKIGCFFMWDNGASWGLTSLYEEPTHWMPLPKPPEV